MNRQSDQFLIKSSILDRKRLLSIHPEYLEFDDKDALSSKPTRILRADIEAYRFGIKWIRGYKLRIGRIYCMDIKAKSGATIKLRMMSVYGVRSKMLGEKYVQVYNSFFRSMVIDIIREYLQLYSIGADFEIHNIVFDQTGVRFKNREKPIKWSDVGTRSYATYFAVFSKTEPDYYKAFEYLLDWNVGIIQPVLDQILKDRAEKKEP